MKYFCTVKRVINTLTTTILALISLTCSEIHASTRPSMPTGAGDSIKISLLTCAPGDEVLIPDPSYVSYAPCVQLCGGTPVVASLLSTAQRLLERPEARKILILLTDGHFERENLRSVPEDVEAAGIELGVLLVGSNAADLWGRHCERIRDVRGVPAGIVKLMKRLLQAARN